MVSQDKSWQLKRHFGVLLSDHEESVLVSGWLPSVAGSVNACKLIHDAVTFSSRDIE
jgi:hypothetical protein